MSAPRFRFYLEMGPLVDNHHPHVSRVDQDRMTTVIVIAETFSEATDKAKVAMSSGRKDRGKTGEWAVRVQHFEECAPAEDETACGTCGGQGYFHILASTPVNEPSHAKRISCPNCNGTGTC